MSDFQRLSLLETLARKPLVLDAAMGTRLIARGLNLERDDAALWNLRRPEDVLAIHETDLRAGSDTVLTNTFGANRNGLDRLGEGDQTRAVNRRAVELSRSAGNADHFVLGSIGSGFLDFSAIVEQATILEDEGVDAILLETFPSSKALETLARVKVQVTIPVFVSLYDWDQPVRRMVKRLEEAGASAVGANCVSYLGRVIPLAEELLDATNLPVLIQPNTGPPDEEPETARSFGEAALRLYSRGLKMFGGCCGTDEAYVAEIRKACYHPVSG